MFLGLIAAVSHVLTSLINRSVKEVPVSEGVVEHFLMDKSFGDACTVAVTDVDMSNGALELSESSKISGGLFCAVNVEGIEDIGGDIFLNVWRACGIPIPEWERGLRRHN